MFIVNFFIDSSGIATLNMDMNKDFVKYIFAKRSTYVAE